MLILNTYKRMCVCMWLPKCMYLSCQYKVAFISSLVRLIAFILFYGFLMLLFMSFIFISCSLCLTSEPFFFISLCSSSSHCLFSTILFLFFSLDFCVPNTKFWRVLFIVPLRLYQFLWRSKLAHYILYIYTQN